MAEVYFGAFQILLKILYSFQNKMHYIFEMQHKPSNKTAILKIKHSDTIQHKDNFSPICGEMKIEKYQETLFSVTIHCDFIRAEKFA